MNSHSIISALPRHYRHIVFVGENTTEQSLRLIFEANMYVWGGRYNPVVPVRNNSIDERWMNLIRNYDPDYIYHTSDINPNFLRDLNLFEVSAFHEIKELHRPNFLGVNIHSLLHEFVKGDIFIRQPLTLLHVEGLYQLPLIAKDFFRLNIGLVDLYAGDSKLASPFKKLLITHENYSDVCKLITEYNPYFKSLLSEQHLQNIFFDARTSRYLERFELIVYKEGTGFNDLIYFWNRQLYFRPKNKLRQIIISDNELEELVSVPFFEAMLYRIAESYEVSFTSLSLETNAKERLLQKLRSECNRIQFLQENVEVFPFEYWQYHSTVRDAQKWSKQLLRESEDLIQLPKPVFFPGNSVVDGDYAVDIVIERQIDDFHKEVKFPLNTAFQINVCKMPGRVKRSRELSLYIARESKTISFKVPSDSDIIRSVLLYREIEGKLISHNIHLDSNSNAGQKLAAFVKLFHSWFHVEQFIEDRFWMQLFTYQSDFGKDSAIQRGRGVFSLQDLRWELEQLYKKYRNQIETKINNSRKELSEVDVDKLIERYITEDIEEVVQHSLQDLMCRNAVFMGMKVKCNICGSLKWYSLKELDQNLVCKGCYSNIIPQIKSQVYFKLSDVIINNLVNDQTKNERTYDGNYVVLKTLLSLKRHTKDTFSSFAWSAPLEIEYGKGERRRSTDIDIVAILEGKLFLGEAKNKASEFNRKEIEFLIWMGNHLKPDVILLAYQSGQISESLKKVRDGITDLKVEVREHKISKPWYHFRGLFGFPYDEGN